jgi:hypothetical protein
MRAFFRVKTNRFGRKAAGSGLGAEHVARGPDGLKIHQVLLQRGQKLLQVDRPGLLRAGGCRLIFLKILG